MAYRFSTIASVLSTTPQETPAHDPFVRHLLYDSRLLQVPAQTVFFALQGKRNDGHRYIADLYGQGVRCFVVSQPPKGMEEATFLVVKNTLRALQRLVVFHRQQFDLDVVGITGSNGKTIVKEWLFQLLQADWNIVRSPKSYNSQIGVPISVWQVHERHELGIFEAGISQKGEMQHLAQIIGCQAGIFTNIGSAHASGFESRSEKVKEKLQLFSPDCMLLYCQDYSLIHQAVQAQGFRQTLAWSKEDPQAAFYIQHIHSDENSTHIAGRYQGGTVRITIPFTDAASIENAIHCWAFLLYKQYPERLIQKRMLRLEPVAMRLELKQGVRGNLLINDSYNSDLEGLRIALHFMRQHSNRPRHCLILSDILQTGLPPSQLYQAVADLIAGQAIDIFVGIGTQIRILAKYLPASVQSYFYETTATFVENFPLDELQHTTILIKGARVFGFEKISNILLQKVHKTVLEVNLSALQHNLRQYTQRLQADTRILVMVKAAAYGSGSKEVAQLLENQGVDYLGVAYADEGVELRRAGVQLPILVLNADESAFDTIIRYHLEPEIYIQTQLQQFIRAVQRASAATYPIHIKMDTGMKRLGFETAALESLADLLVQNTSVEVRSIFTHLVGSESSVHDAFSHKQIALFEKNYTHLTTRLGYRPWRHILNSGGILRFPQYQMDMVRLGIGLYGVDSSKTLALETVLSLKATISQIKTVRADETIGYNRAGHLAEGGRIAVISIGYADGLLRRAGNGRFSVWLHGKYAPIVGNVCMDMCMIDVTHIPQAQVGDVVEIFGNHQSVRVLAKALDTIPYEVFTNLSARVRRVYFQE